MMHHHGICRRALGLVLVAGLVLAACGDDDDTSAVGDTTDAVVDGDGSSTGADTSVSYPVEVDNCGRTVTIDAPPERIVGIDQISTELLLELGVADRIVGTANQSDPPVETLADDFATVPVLSTNYPTAEELVASEPDLVVGNLEFLSFSQDAGFGGPLTRDELEAQGAASFALICMDETDTAELMLQRFAELGQILGVPDAAAAGVAEAEAAVDGVAAALEGTDPVPTLIYIDGTGPVQTLVTPLERVGGVNVVGPDEGGCCPPEIGVEALVERNPQAILLSSFGNLDPSGPSAADKQAALAELLPTVTAVQDERYLSIDFIAFSTPARLARDVVAVAQFLHPDLELPSAS